MDVQDLRKILLLMATKEHKLAAVEIHKMADQLRALALRLEAEEATVIGRGGMSERIQMNVVGPDGKIKRSVDTHPNKEQL